MGNCNKTGTFGEYSLPHFISFFHSSKKQTNVLGGERKSCDNPFEKATQQA